MSFRVDILTVSDLVETNVSRPGKQHNHKGAGSLKFSVKCRKMTVKISAGELQRDYRLHAGLPG